MSNVSEVPRRQIVGTCQDCVHWKKGKSDFQGSDEVERSKVKDEIGVCQRLTGLTSGRATVAWCGCCGDADLVTHQTFGCVQFEQRLVAFRKSP